jgi:hypothetical protein
MQNKVSLESHQDIKRKDVRTLQGDPRTQPDFDDNFRTLIRGRERLGFLDFHFDVATLDRAGARLVAQYFGAALFT